MNHLTKHYANMLLIDLFVSCIILIYLYYDRNDNGFRGMMLFLYIYMTINKEIEFEKMINLVPHISMNVTNFI